jgi:nucleoside-diphosphate kinase
MELTLSIVKPDGVKRNIVGKVLSMIEGSGLRIAATKMVHLSRREAEQFYAVHAARPFYGELVESMCSGPVVVSVLEGSEAISKYREIMGATDPKKATPGTIRAELALSIGENTVHGSDSVDNAKQEVSFFFAGTEIVNRVMKM